MAEFGPEAMATSGVVLGSQILALLNKKGLITTNEVHMVAHNVANTASADNPQQRDEVRAIMAAIFPNSGL